MEKRTRRQLCYVLSVLMMLMMFLSSMTIASADSQSNGTAGAPIAKATSVNDVSKHWAKEQINDWVSKGFVKGYSDNTFKPDKTITRAEFITMVNNVFGFVEKAPISFKDVKTSDWYNAEIAKAIEIGYVKGYSDGTMKPNAQISRQEVAAVIANILRLQAAENSTEIQKLKDIKDSKTWAKGAIGAVLEHGYMKGI